MLVLPDSVARQRTLPRKSEWDMSVCVCASLLYVFHHHRSSAPLPCLRVTYKSACRESCVLRSDSSLECAKREGQRVIRTIKQLLMLYEARAERFGHFGRATIMRQRRFQAAEARCALKRERSPLQTTRLIPTGREGSKQSCWFNFTFHSLLTQLQKSFSWNWKSTRFLFLQAFS